MATSSLGFDNFFSTTLNGALGDDPDSDLTISLNAVPTASEGFLVIEGDNASKREVIYYTSKGASSVTCPSGAGNGRGYDGSTATSHADGAGVEMAPVAAMFEALQDLSAMPATDVTPASTPLAWTNPYCFRAHPAAATTLADNVENKVTMATEDYDPNSNYASDEYTIPVDGFYHFSATVALATPVAGGVTVWCGIAVDGATVFRGGNNDPVNYGAATVSGGYYCTAGEKITVRALQNSDGSEDTNATGTVTWFSGHLVHAA